MSDVAMFRMAMGFAVLTVLLHLRRDGMKAGGGIMQMSFKTHDLNSQPEQGGGASSRGNSAHSQRERYKIVSVRLRVAEFEEFSEQATAAGLTHSLALRIAIRRIGGFLEADPDTRHSLEEILRAIGAVSRGVTQLNELWRQNAELDMELFTQQRREFGMEFARLDALLRSILNVSRRRSDGRLRLHDSATR